MRNRITFFLFSSFFLLNWIASAAGLVVDESPIQMSSDVGGQRRDIVTVSAATAGVSGVSVTASTTSGGNWLTVKAFGQATSPSFVVYLGVTADATNLQAGTYNGKITVTATGVSNSPLVIPVIFSVGGVGPPPPTTGSIVADISQLTFTGQAGGPQPGAKQVNLTSDPSGASFTAAASTTSGGSWLKVSPTSGTTPSSLSVSVDTTGLSMGTYYGNIAISPGSGSEIDVAVTLTLTSGSALTVDSSGLQFFYQFGSLAPSPQTFNVTGGSTPLTFNVTASMTDGSGWLSVDPANGTTPQTEKVSVAPTGLAAGVYKGKITVAATTAANGSVEVPVTLTVSAGALLTAGAAPTPFSYQTGGTVPAPQTVAIGSLGTPVTFTVTSFTTDNGGWLTVSPATGTTPQNLTIAVDPSSLTPGSYSGTVIVTAPSATNSPLKIPVTLNVTSNTTLTASMPAVVLNYQIGGVDEVLSQPIVVTSTNGAVTVNAVATASSTASSCPAGWLQAFPNSIVTPGIVNATLNPSGLSQPQSCIGAIVLSGGGAPIQIPVTANIATTPFFNVRPQALVFNAPYLSTQTNSQTIELSTTDRSVAMFAVPAVTSAGGPWLSAGPQSGSTRGSVTATVDPGQMPVGTYSGLIRITSLSLAQGQTIPVTLNITPTSTAAVAPTSLTFTQVSGAAPPPAQIVNVTASGGAQFFTAAAVQGSLPSAVLSVSPVSGSTPTGVAVSLLANSLPAGSYDASVTVAVPAAGATPITIPVKVNITKTPTGGGLAATPASLSFKYEQGGTAPASQQVDTTAVGAPLKITAAAAAGSGATWLAVTPGSGTTPVSFAVSVDPTKLAAGAYTGTVTLSPPDAVGAPITIPVSLVVTTPPVTVSRITAIANAASGVRGPISPGEIVAISGSGLGPATGLGVNFTPDGTVNTLLGGIRVFFDEFAAPLLYVSAGQVNAIVPYEVANRATVQVTEDKAGVRSDPYAIQVNTAVPGVFTGTQNGRGQGAILNEDSSYNGSLTPAARGSIVQIFGTGEGVTTPPGVTGSVTLTRRAIAGRVTATVGGIPAQVMFAGAAPQAVAGLFQINVRIPDNALTGDVPIVIGMDSASTQTGVTVAIK